MFQSVFEWRHSELLLEDADEVLGCHESNICGQLAHIDIRAFQQDAGVLQSHISNQFCRRLIGDAPHSVEERYSSHTHRAGHLLETDLSAAHVLHHILLDVLQQLLIHSVEHREV